MNITEQLKAIVPGKTYPRSVTVTEPDNTIIAFYLNSFYVGMYCAIHINGIMASQTGDRNNKKFCAGLKRDILKAIARGAIVEISEIFPIQSEMS